MVPHWAAQENPEKKHLEWESTFQITYECHGAGFIPWWTKLREYIGICIESSYLGVTSFLTSIELIPRSWPRRQTTLRLSAPVCLFVLIEFRVCLPDDQIVTGWIDNPGLEAPFLILMAALLGWIPKKESPPTYKSLQFFSSWGLSMNRTQVIVLVVVHGKFLSYLLQSKVLCKSKSKLVYKKYSSEKLEGVAMHRSATDVCK